MTGCIPQTQVDRLAVHHHVRGIVVEHGRNILAREGISCVGNKEARLTDGTIAHHDALDVLHLRTQTTRSHETHEDRTVLHKENP